MSQLMTQLQYRDENQNFISHFVFRCIKKTKWSLRYADSQVLFNRHVLDFFETSDLKEVRIFFLISKITV